MTRRAWLDGKAFITTAPLLPHYTVRSVSNSSRQAVLNSRGEVVNYDILSGPDSAPVRRQLDQVLLFSRFRPQMSFGRPTAGGTVILSFSEIRVRG